LGDPGGRNARVSRQGAGMLPHVVAVNRLRANAGDRLQVP
jgi:hypothetical protein